MSNWNNSWSLTESWYQDFQEFGQVKVTMLVVTLIVLVTIYKPGPMVVISMKYLNCISI